MASTPSIRFCQYVSRSGAPGSRTAMPTIAISVTRSPAGRRIYHRGLGRVAPGQLAQQAQRALLRVDERDPAPGVLALQVGGDHAAVRPARRPRSPVDGQAAVAGAGGPGSADRL